MTKAVSTEPLISTWPIVGTSAESAKRRLTCLDLFCGCGGFSLGMQRAGFAILGAIDLDEKALNVYKINLPAVRHPLLKDITRMPASELAQIIGATSIDVVVGGPPCQGFSNARRRDGANSGPRLIEDKRRHLYKDFLRFVEYFRPKVFVMENVVGMKSAAHGVFFARVQEEARRIGYRVHPQVEKASDLGVPQKRMRQLIIGTRLDLVTYFPARIERVRRAPPSPTLGEAVGDLPPLRAGGGANEAQYDMSRRRLHVSKYGRQYLYRVLEIGMAKNLTGHVARPHSARDLRDFARLREGEHSGQALSRGVSFESPYDTSHFGDRYTRQHRDRVCSTIVAHMSKDGLMFIHPTQNRSLTPREAARVQSFPDWYQLPVPRTDQFKLIGNAVPPLVAEALGFAIKSYLKNVGAKKRKGESFSRPVPQDCRDAARRVASLVGEADRKQLHRVPPDEFRRGWFAVCFLYPELHPISALEDDARTSPAHNIPPMFRTFDPRLFTPFYVQSGWPVALAPVIREAWRRSKSAELADSEFYCSDAAAAGMLANKNLRLFEAEEALA